MPRDYPVPVTPSDMEEYAVSLERLAAAHHEIAKCMTERGIEIASLKAFKSATDAMENLLRFLGSSYAAVVETTVYSSAVEAMRLAADKEAVARASLSELQKLRSACFAHAKQVADREREAVVKAKRLISGQKGGQAKTK